MTVPDAVKILNKMYIDNGVSQKIVFPRMRRKEEKFDLFIAVLDYVITKPNDAFLRDNVKNWFYTLAEKMNSDLRALYHCITAFWSYSHDQYEQYEETQKKKREKNFAEMYEFLKPEKRAKGPSQDVVGPETMSFETFQWVCDYYDTRWAAPGYLATICEEILTLAPIIILTESPVEEDNDMIWYDEETAAAFRILHDLFLEEEKNGSEKVRMVTPNTRLF